MASRSTFAKRRDSTGYLLFQRNVEKGTVWRTWSGARSHITISVEQPRGEELAETDAVVRRLEARLLTIPDVARFTSEVYPQSGRIRVEFPDSLQNTVVPITIKEHLEAYSQSFGGTKVRVIGFGPSFYGGGSAPPTYSIQVLGYNYEQVRRITAALADRLARFPRIQNVDANADAAWYSREKSVEVTLLIDRRRLAPHGLSPKDVMERVSAAVGRLNARDLIRVDEQEISLAVRLRGSERIDTPGLQELLIPAPTGQAVRLGDVAKLGERETLSRILREDQQYRRTMRYEFHGPEKLGERIRGSVIKSADIPPGYRVEGREEYRWSKDEEEQVLGVLFISLMLIFMVTAALFESLRQPLCVMLTIPMALVGVFLVFSLVYHSGAYRNARPLPSL